MLRLFFATIVLIVYGSLYPWNFHSRQLIESPLWVLIHSWPVRYGREWKDIVINIILYFPLGVFGFLSLFRSRAKALRICAAVGIGFVLSCCIELLQLLDAGRYTSALDVTTNTAGAALGALGAALLPRLPPTQRCVLSGAYRQPSALFVLVCYVVFQLFPLFPDFSLYRMPHKVTVLWTASGFSIHIFLVSLILWLLAARLVETAFSPEWVPRLLAALVLLAPAKLFILGRTTTLAELTGVATAYILWRFAVGAVSWRPQILAMLVTLLIIGQGLAPFQFSSSPAQFNWIPFAGLMQADRFNALYTIIEKLYTYSAFIWILVDSGLTMRWAAMGSGGVLAFIELAQLYLPGRVPEITDPLLALLIAWFVSVLDRWRRSSSTLKSGASMASKY